jgi:DNA-binding response OmpR family regulator
MKGKKVLIIDDEKDLLDALGDALRESEFTVFEARNGEEGLRIALEEKPDAILLDITMPQMTGHEVLNELRKDSWGKDVKVIVLSNRDDLDNISDGFGQKGDDYIIKSNASLREIITKVKQHLVGYYD